MADETKTLECKIKDCADQCGLTCEDVKQMCGVTALEGVGAIDGSRILKFLDFLKTILPLILPLFVEPGPMGSAAPAKKK